MTNEWSDVSEWSKESEELCKQVSRSLPRVAELCSKELHEIADGKEIPFILVVPTAPLSNFATNIKRDDAIDCLEQMLKYLKAGGGFVSAHEIN